MASTGRRSDCRGRTERRSPVPPLKQVTVLLSGRHQNLYGMGEGKTLRVSRIVPPKKKLTIFVHLSSFSFHSLFFFSSITQSLLVMRSYFTVTTKRITEIFLRAPMSVAHCGE